MSLCLRRHLHTTIPEHMQRQAGLRPMFNVSSGEHYVLVPVTTNA